MSSLSRAALAALPSAILRPGHAVDGLRTGIVHFGPALSTARTRRPMSTGCSTWTRAGGSPRCRCAAPRRSRRCAARTGSTRWRLIDRAPGMRILAAHSDALGPGEGARLRRLLADPAVRIATSTVTEKGYCLGADGTLDFNHPDVIHDRARRRRAGERDRLDRRRPRRSPRRRRGPVRDALLRQHDRQRR